MARVDSASSTMPQPACVPDICHGPPIAQQPIPTAEASMPLRPSVRFKWRLLACGSAAGLAPRDRNDAVGASLGDVDPAVVRIGVGHVGLGGGPLRIALMGGFLERGRTDHRRLDEVVGIVLVVQPNGDVCAVSYTHLRAHEPDS